MHSRTLEVGSEAQQLSDDELRAQYRGYRRRQARALVRLLPRDAIRPLYRCAVRGAVSDDPRADPLEALIAYCESLIPLPPFEIWRADLARHPWKRVRWTSRAAGGPRI
jgi:hypothetical protein